LITESPPRPSRLLIVDDDVLSIRVLGEVVKGMGELFFSTNGPNALRLAAETQPDIVLLDAEMPEMDGFEVCRRLKANPLTADASIIFVTAHTNIGHEMAALEAGAIDFIHKPISPPVVQARVRNHLLLKFQSDKLRQLASIDPLTGISNRRAFDLALDAEWLRARRIGRPMAVLMTDVDYFKCFNDGYGHLAGDDGLRGVAQALRAAARRPHELVARYGGEEFAIILPDSDFDNALRFAELLCQSVRDLEIPHAYSKVAPILTISVGAAATIPQKDALPASIVDAADQALYQAKDTGRNRAVGKRL